MQFDCVDAESFGDSVYDVAVESADSLENAEEIRRSDSGCSSGEMARNIAKKDITKVCSY